MAYSKTNWQDSPSTATPITASRLNNMENGIYDIDTKLNIRTGSWTPTLTLTDGGNVSYVFSHVDENGVIQTGYATATYYTIGKICYVSSMFKAYITSYSSEKYVRIGDLPFAPAQAYSFANMTCHGAISDLGYGDFTWNGETNEKKVRLQTEGGTLQSEIIGTGWVWLSFSGTYLIS